MYRMTAEMLGMGGSEVVEPINDMGRVAVRTSKEVGRIPPGELQGIVAVVTLVESAFQKHVTGQPEITNRTPEYVTWRFLKKTCGFQGNATYEPLPGSLSELSVADQALTARAMRALQTELTQYDIDLGLDDPRSILPVTGEAVIMMEDAQLDLSVEV